jgi:hypothetical protein
VRSARKVMSASGRVCAVGLTGRYWPILLKNSISAGHGKILASKRREACVDMRGHKQQLPSPRMVS